MIKIKIKTGMVHGVPQPPNSDACWDHEPRWTILTPLPVEGRGWHATGVFQLQVHAESCVFIGTFMLPPTRGLSVNAA